MTSRYKHPRKPKPVWPLDLLIGGAVALLVIAALWIASGGLARGQDTHAQFHAFYQNWVNGDAKGCCNDADCSALSDDYLATINGELMAFIRGVGPAKGQADWCPVLPKHYLTQGNAPNWSTAHACVSAHYRGMTPCEQFICFQPKPAI